MLDCAAMSTAPLHTTPPPTPLYRISLFFGPEPVEQAVETSHCVFNVKKRSWKAGIQVAVHLTQETIAAARTQTHLDARLAVLGTEVPKDERETTLARAEELYVVELARLVLHAALDRGLPQENSVVESSAYEDLLKGLSPADGTRILQHIYDELDLSRPDALSADA